MKIRRLAAFFFCLILCLSFSLAFSETEAPVVTQAPETTNEQIVEDAENGIWSYKTDDLSITITRKSDDVPTVWYEVEIFASENSPLTTVVRPGKKPGTRLVNPKSFAIESQAVLAITDDFFGFRINHEQRVGIVVRNGEILGDKTRNSQKNRGWPNLDTLAVYKDGSMKTYVCDAYTAEEYVQMGATDVFAFGPVLISEGVITDYILDKDYYPYNEPRMAIGMVEPYHYYILAVEGRNDSSKGARLPWMAEKLQELGCTEALNLDGGGTCALMFMGKVLNRSDRNMRAIGSLITFGTSAQIVPEK